MAKELTDEQLNNYIFSSIIMVWESIVQIVTKQRVTPISERMGRARTDSITIARSVKPLGVARSIRRIRFGGTAIGGINIDFIQREIKSGVGNTIAKIEQDFFRNSVNGSVIPSRLISAGKNAMPVILSGDTLETEELRGDLVRFVEILDRTPTTTWDMRRSTGWI